MSAKQAGDQDSDLNARREGMDGQAYAGMNGRREREDERRRGAEERTPAGSVSVHSEREREQLILTRFPAYGFQAVGVQEVQDGTQGEDDVRVVLASIA